MYSDAVFKIKIVFVCSLLVSGFGFIYVVLSSQVPVDIRNIFMLIMLGFMIMSSIYCAVAISHFNKKTK